jgi:hypothetical protein
MRPRAGIVPSYRGIAAIDPDGLPLGVVVDLELAPHPVLVVRSGGGERRVPLVTARCRGNTVVLAATTPQASAARGRTVA